MATTNVIPIDRRQVRPGECLYCHLTRVLEVADCEHTMKLTSRWIDAQTRSARWVVNWAKAQGGECDCEVLTNAFRDSKRSARHRKLRCQASYELSASELGRCDGADG